jgi:hypothetical protein
MKEKFEYKRKDRKESFIHRYDVEIFSFLTIAVFIITVIGIGFAYYLSVSPEKASVFNEIVNEFQKNIML